MIRMRRWHGWALWGVLTVTVALVAWPRREALLLKNRFINRQSVERLGYGGYFWFDVVDVAGRLWRRAHLDEIDPAPYRAYLRELAHRRAEMPARHPPRRKHVVYIQLESMDGLVIGARKDGQPVMPFLEDLAAKHVSFANMMDNTGSGRTTDGEFLVLTSLVPLARQPVYVSKDLSRVPSLPRVLHVAGYHTASIHGFNGVFWHRAEAHTALGYDEMRFQQDLPLDDKIGWGWSDEAVLGEAARMIAAAESPLFLHVITLTHHHPYDHIAHAQGLKPGRIEVENVRSARYVDHALQGFFQQLQDAGVLEDCLIAIYGDHDSAIDVELEAYLDSIAPRLYPDTVPLVLVGFDRPAQRVTTLAGLQDLPVMILQELGLDVPLTFTGAGWGQWGTTFGAQHRGLQEVNGAAEPWEPPVDQDILTRLAIEHPEELLAP
ncbi:LTA synthase family protein [Synoicihabitans lomoniglobus]|uniref:LTA synthase family protein n=1 Tax=Synoicihabitans lomoniglobus TaxID=2909285 RepID=A0AAE9ZQJ1_9BACT|nr:LTA synthase family protein [Opitutaceae bacterium LMO-M01]WED63255.1 LTA synthase family protein [Opitutaceae bacterium LMO-M01]